MFTQKSLIKIIAASCALGTAVLATPVQATSFADGYVGSNDHGLGDVIGDSLKFDILSLNSSLSGTMLTISITTNFAGKGDDGLFSSNTVGGTGIGYGDLLLSSSWNPYGTAPYTGDNASNGTVWGFGFALDDRWMNEASSGTGTFYSLNSGDNSVDTLLSNDFMTGATYRGGQAVAVDTAGGNITALSAGTWGISGNTVNFTIDLAGTGLLGSDIAVRWAMTCANDAIEGQISTVPVPAAAWLFGSGLLAMIGVARRKIS